MLIVRRLRSPVVSARLLIYVFHSSLNSMIKSMIQIGIYSRFNILFNGMMIRRCMVDAIGEVMNIVVMVMMVWWSESSTRVLVHAVCRHVRWLLITLTANRHRQNIFIYIISSYLHSAVKMTEIDSR